jgi:hypothetical protein
MRRSLLERPDSLGAATRQVFSFNAGFATFVATTFPQLADRRNNGIA